jgi:hypothetical protein
MSHQTPKNSYNLEISFGQKANHLKGEEKCAGTLSCTSSTLNPMIQDNLGE